jgi:hypothetical protein
MRTPEEQAEMERLVRLTVEARRLVNILEHTTDLSGRGAEIFHRALRRSIRRRRTMIKRDNELSG